MAVPEGSSSRGPSTRRRRGAAAAATAHTSATTAKGIDLAIVTESGDLYPPLSACRATERLLLRTRVLAWQLLSDFVEVVDGVDYYHPVIDAYMTVHELT